jgi:hypothetical protein
LNTALLLWGVIFSSIGFGYFLYGRKQKAAIPLVCGIALMVVPYFISSSLALVFVGVTLAVIPFYIKI